MTAFSTLHDRLPALPEREGDPPAWPRIGRGGVSFSDDLLLRDGQRLGVRVRIIDRDSGGYTLDLRDSDPSDATGRFALAPGRAMTATLLALGHALGEPACDRWRDHVELVLEPSSWIGTDDAVVDPAAIAFGMARLADAILGALANAWPGRVGAGSCGLGAVVELGPPQAPWLTEVLPGGEGGHPDRAGADAWPGLVLPAAWPSAPDVADGITLDGELRESSGGVGRRGGGRGVVRRYRVTRPTPACVAFDRTSNPPHGIDRAGPPQGTLVRVHPPDGSPPRSLQPWERLELPAGACLEVQTCGGAGWGFPGYGDIEWDPGDWFGSKPKPS